MEQQHQYNNNYSVIYLYSLTGMTVFPYFNSFDSLLKTQKASAYM